MLTFTGHFLLSKLNWNASVFHLSKWKLEVFRSILWNQTFLRSRLHSNRSKSLKKAIKNRLSSISFGFLPLGHHTRHRRLRKRYRCGRLFRFCFRLLAAWGSAELLLHLLVREKLPWKCWSFKPTINRGARFLGVWQSRPKSQFSTSGDRIHAASRALYAQCPSICVAAYHKHNQSWYLEPSSSMIHQGFFWKTCNKACSYLVFLYISTLY